MTETATTDPVLTSSILRAGTFLTRGPTRADLTDLKIVMRTAPIGSQPGIPYFAEPSEDGNGWVAGERATGLVEVGRLWENKPVPASLMSKAAAYEKIDGVLVLYTLCS